MNQKNTDIIELALLAVVGSLILWPSYLTIKVGELPGLNMTRLLIVLTIYIWLLALLKEHSYQKRLTEFISNNHSLLIFIFLPYFTWSFMTVFSSENLQSSLYSSVKDFVYYFVLFTIASTVWYTPRKLMRAISFIVYLSVIVICVAWVEYFLQRNLFANLTPESFIGIETVTSGIFRDDVYRSWGTFSHPLALAQYCITVLPLVLWFASNNRMKRTFIGYTVSIFLILTVFLTGSRSGIGVIIFMSVGYFTFTRLPNMIKHVRSMKSALIIVVAILFALTSIIGTYFIGNELVSGRSITEEGSSSIRLLQLELGVPLVMARPIMGYGPGEAAEVLGLSAKTIDNYYMTLVLESGFPVVLLFIVMQFYFILLAWSLQKKIQDSFGALSTAIMWAIAGNLIMLAIVSLEDVLPVMFLLFAMLISLKSYSEKKYPRNIHNTNSWV